MNFKDNLVQAAKELMNGPEAARAVAATESSASVESPAQVAQRQEPKMVQAVAAPTSQQEAAFVPDFRPDSKESSVFPPISVPETPMRTETRSGAIACTLLSVGTRIIGSIETDDNVELYGYMNGNLSSKGDLKLCGKLEGDAAGNDIQLLAGRVKGNLDATGNLLVDNEAVVLGDVRAKNLSLNGKIKGNLEISDTLVLESNAVVLGNIAAGRTCMREGAVFQGEMRITSADMGKMFPGAQAAPTAAEQAFKAFAPKKEPTPDARNVFAPKAAAEPRSAFTAKQETAEDARSAFTAKQETAASVEPTAPVTPTAPSGPANPFSVKREGSGDSANPFSLKQNGAAEARTPFSIKQNGADGNN